ncbi:MAG: diaminopimelate decarboxylase [Bifidobacteriaceae bacterium]|jgi:diaminopimelate decarboxylase|nr:diaminopimelate decarboxylase [Bifidobacteriaceae bacterium]
MATHEAGALHAAGHAPAWLLVPDDVNDLLQPLWPVTAYKDADGVLQVGGLPVTEIAAQVGTPAYVIDEADFRGRATIMLGEFQEAFAAPPLAGADVYYAAKALITLGIARWLVEDGLRVDVASGGELAILVRAGMPGERIALHGNNKADRDIETALQAGVGRIMIDSLPEINQVAGIAGRLGVKAKVMLRCSIGVEAHTHEYIATSHEDQKFGLSVADGAGLEAVRRVLARPELELLGVHSHIGSQIFDTNAFALAIHRLVALTATIAHEYGHACPELGLGGGFGVAYTTGHDPLTPRQTAQGMAAAVAKECQAVGIAAPRVSVEPGRAIAAPAGITLYTVGVTKEVSLGGGFQRLYIAVDGGMSDNIRTALYGADYSATLASRRSEAPPRLARIVGQHCESGDIVVKDEYMPADITAGDLVAVPVTGAYCRSMSSNYNAALRPPVVAVKDGAIRTLVRRETLEDLLATDLG